MSARPIKSTFILTLFAICTCSILVGQEAFVKAITENTHLLGFEEGNNSFELLDSAIGESQFTMIGEAHGLAEVQMVSSSLFSIANGHGYDVMVIETDPYCAAKVSQLAQADESESLDFASKYPMAIPFFHSNEAMQMARNIAAKGADFWGVDQVFIVAPRYLFAKLARLAESTEANALAADYAGRAQEAFNSAMSSGQPGDVLLMHLTDEDFDALRNAFRGESSAIEMIDQIQLSRDIYQFWYDGQYYLNNKVRSDLMKRLFLEEYHERLAGEEEPKVMFKLGSNHAVRGLTSTHIYDLGNTITELAAINATASTHVRLTAARGTTFNMLAGVQEFDDTENWHPWLQDALNPLIADTDVNYLLIDLRPLRNLPMKTVDSELRDLVFGWDFWIIIREANAVTPIGQ